MFSAAPLLPVDPDPSRRLAEPQDAAEVREALIALRVKLESVRDALDLLEELAQGDGERPA